MCKNLSTLPEGFLLISDYFYVFVFFVIGVAFVLFCGIAPLFISPRSRGDRASEPYESGEVPVGSAWIRFDIYYYLLALVFLAFAVESVFLFPVLVAYRSIAGPLPFIEVSVFLGILSFAIAYSWRKGVFEWK
ncbi:MAG: NADH-quinone oxidoreductase subunit A [Candidatus Omnitrophica bacterium]|nr:NADH-quinone oxidoreductase subunit A [Candidatus Omnitrophota bacterium]